jgi:hypothetical protein
VRAGSSAVVMLASQASVCVDAITVCPPKEREVAGSNPAQSTICSIRDVTLALPGF